MTYGTARDLPRYSRAARALHWIVALLVFVTWPLGLMIGFVKEEAKSGFYLVHESFGFLVLWVMLLRVGYRLFQPSPPIKGPAIERVAAHTVHGLIYIFLIIMPVSGFLATNAHGFPLQWFGVVPGARLANCRRSQRCYLSSTNGARGSFSVFSRYTSSE